MFIKKLTILGFRGSTEEISYDYSTRDVNFLSSSELQAIQLLFDPYYDSNHDLREFIDPRINFEVQPFVQIECEQDEKRLFLLNKVVILKRNLTRDSKWIYVNGSKTDANVVFSILNEGFLKANGLDVLNILDVSKMRYMEQMNGQQHWKIILDLFGPRKLIKLMGDETVIAKALREHDELTQDRKELHNEVQNKEKQLEDARVYNKLEKRFNTLQHIHSTRELLLLQVDHDKLKPQIDEIETQYVEALREKADNMNKIFVNEVTLETFEHLEKIKKQRICDLQIKKDFIFDRIDKNERFLLDADNFWLSKENHRKLLTEADKVCQKISGFFEKRRKMLMEKNQLEIQIDVNMMKFHFSKATEANFPLLMNYIQNKIPQFLTDKVRWEQKITDLKNLLSDNKQALTDIPETDSCFNAYISQFSDLPESSKSFHEHRFEKLQQIDISTKEIVEASIDKLDILIEIENLRIIGGFDKKIIEGLVNVEFFMGKLNEDDYYDRILKDDYVGPVFLHLTDDDVELEARFWEQIKCIATHLMFKQYSSVKVFRARFRETNYSMFALDEFYTPNPPGLPDDLNIERATQLVSRDFEFAQVLLRAFQEIIYLPDPKHLQLLLHRRQIVMYEDGSQSYCQGEYSGGAMSEDQMIQDPEVTRVRVLKEIYNRITSQLVPEMIKIWNAEIQVKDAQNWSRDNMEQKAVEGEIDRFDIINPNCYLKYYQHTKDLIHAQYVLQFINMSLEHYLQFSKFKFGDQLDVSVPRRVIESWKSELAACDKKQEILSKMVEYLGQELEGFVDSLHNERFEIKCLLALHPLHELDKPTISTSIEFLKNDLIFVDQSLQEYQALLKKDREEILNKQQLHPAVLIETEMRVVQLKNDLTNLNHRATITKTYKKEHQDIINGLSPERMQSQKTFDQMLKMTNEALVKALLTSHRDLLEAHGSLTAEQRAKLKDAIEDTKLFQRSDLDVKQSSVKVYPYMNRHLISAMQSLALRLEESCKIVFKDFVKNCQFVLNMQTNFVTDLSWETFDFATIKSLDLKMEWIEALELPFETTVNCIKTLVLIAILVQHGSKIKYIMIDQQILMTFGPVLEGKIKQFLKAISPQVQSFIFNKE